ncbi:hypothetical protein PVK06_003237 [Gossypium arboreum]|uniref:Uncharacterized protein n=1 Tax=Gossypium arboreum TaxID=29729 RepID=A0ABR0R6V7_GOSAR|nr:hypothetical protein PVK06_003237 [Gossypium arboreum]
MSVDMVKLRSDGGQVETMVTTVSGRKVVAADASQFNHSGKGRGLVWQGKEVITKRQLQQQEDSIRMTRRRPPKNHTIGTQGSQT